MTIAAIDQGTTSTRALTLRPDGGAAVVTALEHSQHYPRPGWVEHDPEELIANLRACIGAVADAEALIRYLARHGVKAEAKTSQSKTMAVGAEFLEEAGRISAGLLVMGGYTHSRVRQMVFGGVTKHVLANAKLPVLFAH